jgi:hypothetical protein
VQALIDHLIERGLDPRGLPVDGAEALSKVVRRTIRPAT